MAQFIHLEEPPRPAAAPGFALWALGFRPFYLLASTFAALSIGLWALQFSGVLGQPYLPTPLPARNDPAATDVETTGQQAAA